LTNVCSLGIKFASRTGYLFMKVGAFLYNGHEKNSFWNVPFFWKIATPLLIFVCLPVVLNQYEHMIDIQLTSLIFPQILSAMHISQAHTYISLMHFCGFILIVKFHGNEFYNAHIKSVKLKVETDTSHMTFKNIE
jgi:hypothetical protein